MSRIRIVGDGKHARVLDATTGEAIEGVTEVIIKITKCDGAVATITVRQPSLDIVAERADVSAVSRKGPT